MGLESDGAAIYVVDGRNQRILIWDAMPAAGNHGLPADRIIGQSSFRSSNPNGGGVSDRTVFVLDFWNSGPSQVVMGGRTFLWMPDTLNNRVLRFDVTP